MSELHVIGIDPSLECTAIVWGPLGNEYRLQSSQKLGETVADRVNRNRNLAERVHTTILEATRGEPAMVYIEGYSYGSHAGREVLAEYGGVLRDMLVQFGHTIEEVPPLTLKKFVTGKGAGDKTPMVVSLVKRFGTESFRDDYYDGLGLWWWGMCKTGQMEPLERQKECLAPKAKQPKRRSARPRG